MKAFTPREREIAALIGEGWTNKAIAGRLYVTEKTIDKHLGNIGSKLGHVPGSGYVLRVQIARWAFRHIKRERELNT